MTDRLKKCVETGDVLALFPLLKDWSQDELRALLADIEAQCAEAIEKNDAKHRELAFEPTNFFSRARSKAVDDAAKQAHIQIVGMLSEIASVALYYLREEA